MKKKHRKIVVDDTEYAWSTGNYNGDGDGGLEVRIWKDRKIIYEIFLPYGRVKSVTPALVRDIILEIR